MSAIEGTVINQRDGQPIVGATLKAKGDGVEKEASSGAKGVFSIGGLSAGKYELTASKTGFEEGIYGPIQVFSEFPTTMSLALQPKMI